MRFSFSLLLATLLASLLQLRAQEPEMGEALETFRFIRLAESRKSLSFSEQKLLEVNEIVDAFEQSKAENRKKTQEIQKRALKNLDEKQALEVLEQLLALRTESHELDQNLLLDLRKKLSAKETVEWFVFYERLRREMQKRVRQLQERPLMNQRPPFRRNN